MPVVWALRGFVSICKIKGLITLYLLQIETFPWCRWGGTATYSVPHIPSFLR